MQRPAHTDPAGTTTACTATEPAKPLPRLQQRVLQARSPPGSAYRDGDATHVRDANIYSCYMIFFFLLLFLTFAYVIYDLN